MKIAILALALLLNCATVQEVEYDDKPLWATACSTYEGTAWERCVIKLLDKLGNITSVPPTKEIKNKKRISENEVMVYYQVCFGNADLCAIMPEKKYDPTLWAKVKPHIITGSGFFVLGLIGGLSAKD